MDVVGVIGLKISVSVIAQFVMQLVEFVLKTQKIVLFLQQPQQYPHLIAAIIQIVYRV